MIRVRIIFDAHGWAYYHRAKVLQHYAPSDMQITIAPHSERFAVDCDLLFDLNYGHVAEVRGHLRARPHVLFLTSFNNGWPWRKEHFAAACHHAHAVIVNNREYWEKSGSLPGTYHLSNGVDRRTFTCDVPIRERPARVLWVGSDYHRKLKNYDDILVPLKKRLTDVECDFRVTDPYGAGVKTHAEMARWYNTGSVYIVASNVEGTPNPALEAASCGCALVTTRVGNMPELVRDTENGIFVEPSLASIEAGVRAALARRGEISDQMQLDIARWDWAERSQEFYKLFRALLSGEAVLRRPARTP